MVAKSLTAWGSGVPHAFRGVSGSAAVVTSPESNFAASLRMDIRDLLLANLDDAYGSSAWHGPNLRGALRGLRVDDVVWRPAPGRHNIWELAIHAAYWKYIVRRRILRLRRGSFKLEGSNWFATPPDADEPDWRAIVKILHDEHTALRESILMLPAKRLEDRKVVRTIYGVAAHDVYHTGQISLLKRLRPR